MFGFAGASRTGKSTLCRLLSEGLSLHYHTFNTAEIMKEKGFNLVDPTLPFSVRIDAQEAYLDHYEEMMRKLPRPAITDRTPLCLAGYLLADIRMHDHAELGERVKAYVDRAVHLTDQFFDTVLILRPLPFYEEAEGKAPANLGYQWHHQMVCEGLAMMIDHANVAHIFRTDLEDRAKDCTEVIVRSMKEWGEEKASLSLH
ncbi:hypothetical protein [Methylobacterium sp. AMS5]|uniref:hypothetical protein n=1 Tax=Methylobacterium sp. AMS5 TaxID=925818 RepID=UPI00074FA510|nr:hypothetical protein [Methylobacterium sp. AMS5]AMB48344.1 hypothetical protein Y590_25585 [Methylobacterium sp. AMS5]